MWITKELLDELLAGRAAKTVFERDGPLDQLKKALAERILNADWRARRPAPGRRRTF